MSDAFSLEVSSESDDEIMPAARKKKPPAKKSPSKKPTENSNTEDKGDKEDKISEYSITVSRIAEDLSDDDFEKLNCFLRENCSWFYVGSENGDRELNLHAQGVAGSNQTKAQLHAGIKKKLGFTGQNHSYWNVCVKHLNGNGLHTKIGMIGYCRKNHKAPNFNSWAMNVTEEMQKKGDDLYLVLGKGDLKGRCELTENNIMSKADMFRRFKMKRGFPSFMATVLRMMRSGRYFFSTRIHNSRCRTSQTILAVQQYEGESESDYVNTDEDDDGFEYSNSIATDVTKNRDREVAEACDRLPSRIVIHDDSTIMTDGPVTVETPVRVREKIPPVSQFDSPRESSARGAARVAEQAALLKRKAPECDADRVHKSRRELILGTDEFLDPNEWEEVEAEEVSD
ncbi:hypothetical protein CYMTET_9369 [Cymbomonas tetramitiformis]|uniref:Uncharacterized protein n=1 Tax=Cymbomonas tetramitiformis TaxID=36881 RepID=A0AAE0LEY4_9CHLO|nr:hypothetical protein CYMTET_9369 [Cymbomonas tetramitiformis]